MKIAILTKEFPPDVIGGTETQTARMAEQLGRADHEVTVVTKSYPGSEEDADDLGPGEDSTAFDLVRVPTWHRTPFVSTLTYILFVTLYLVRSASRFDVLQCMTIHPNGFVGYVVSRVTGLPYFVWIRGGDYYFMKDTWWKRAMMARVFDDTLVLVQSEQVRCDVLAEFPDASLEVVGNGVNLSDVEADGDQVVYVGRLVEQKGVHNLLAAAEGLNVGLLIVGDGPARRSLEATAERLGVDARFVGQVPPDSVGEYLKAGKLFVLPSVRGEGLPNAVLEAQAAGLPVVATDTGGVSDAVVDGETGFVVPPDDVAALRDRIEEACRDKSARERMGEAAKRYIEANYAWDAIVETLEGVYLRVIRSDSA